MRVLFLKRKHLIWLVSGGFCLLLLAAGRGGPGATAEALAPYRCGPADADCISLAINVDWGEEYLPEILSTLAKHQARATFFLTGRWTDKFPEQARALAKAGQEIGNHGYSHASPNASSQAAVLEEILRTEESIFRATGVLPRLYAPPAGECDDHVLAAAAEAGYVTVLWSVDTIDWQGPTPEALLERVNRKMTGGAIVLAHPTAATAAALEEMLTEWEAKGYSWVTVSENLAPLLDAAGPAL